MPTIDLPALSTTSSVDSIEMRMEMRMESTSEKVHWGLLAARVCKSRNLDVTAFHWGENASEDSGGDNLIRWLCLHDGIDTTLIVRVPLLLMKGRSPENDAIICKRLTSEIDTMLYVGACTTIPVPHVVAHSIRFDNDVGYPYIVMSHIEGVKMSNVWEDMSDGGRHAVLSQVADITLQLWTHRFGKAGVLVKRKGSTVINQAAFMIKPELAITMSHDLPDRYGLSSTAFSTAKAYWQSYANASFRAIKKACSLGSETRTFALAERWFIRSLVPTLFDPALDAYGFPLAHPDLNMDNIMIDDIDSSPRITGILDWELSGPTYTSSFAYYPSFLIDSPDEDLDAISQNAKDRIVYHRLLEEKENSHVTPLPSHFPLLSKLLSSSHGIHLFRQCVLTPSGALDYFYPILYNHIHHAEWNGSLEGLEPDDDDEAQRSELDAFHQKLENSLLKNCMLRISRKREARSRMQVEPEDDPVPTVTNGQRLFDNLESNLIIDLTSGDRLNEWLDTIL